jgi:hypothetical protein
MVPPVVKAARDRNWRRRGGCGGAILWRCAEYEESHDIITTLTTPAFTERIKQLACDRGQRTECRKVTEVEVSKLEIASEYLDAAIGFFLARTNYFCATHLSAAAEELFGAHLPEDQRIFTLAWKAEKALMSETGPISSDAVARRSVNEWKNDVKHMNDGASPTIRIDPAFAAEHHIEQALINFYKLNLQKSAAVWKFEDHQNHKVRAMATSISS